MQKEHIEVADIAVEVWRKPIKNNNLAVYGPEGRVRISVPHRTSDARVREIIISRLPWIEKQQARFRGLAPVISPKVLNGEMHDVWGSQYPLTVVEGCFRHSVSFDPATGISLHVRSGTSSKVRLHLLNEWYRSELKNRIPPLLEIWEPLVGRSVAQWRTKKMKTRWGTCNIASRRIWLNLELAKKAEECLEYILVHELVHLLVRNHNESFYRHMDRLLPHWRSVDALLKRDN